MYYKYENKPKRNRTKPKKEKKRKKGKKRKKKRKKRKKGKKQQTNKEASGANLGINAKIRLPVFRRNDLDDAVLCTLFRDGSDVLHGIFEFLGGRSKRRGFRKAMRAKPLGILLDTGHAPLDGRHV